ncbi:MAG: TatD family hydrolase [Oscillospiraceae bacterium]|nr:TatD family hydrolase [Oscillospiraceae bacterium]MBR7085122.1 TatD family hydrolase [Oscillospiraceae bacterium]
MQSYSIFDTHAHYADVAFQQDREFLLQEKLPASGIQYVMLAGVTLPDCLQSQALAQQYHYLYCSAGIHPEFVEALPPDWLSQLRKLAQFPKCKAIGEIGLDYFQNKNNKSLQQTILIQQIQLAQELQLPCIFHFREATGDAVQILKTFQPKGIFHCFTCSAEIAQELLAIPELYFSFSGVVTYPNARKPLEALEILPLERILIETDAPYLAPVPFRRQRCDSSMILHTARKIAEIKQIPLQDFITICCENACKIFQI